MALRELFVKLGFEVDEKPLKEFEASLESLKIGIVGLASTIGGAVGSIYGIVNTTAEAGLEISKLSAKTGIGTEALQGLRYAAKRAHIDASEFAIGLKFLNKNIFEASHGSKEALTDFYRLGISFEDLKNLNTEEALYKISDSFKNMPDGPQKTALAVKLLGRSGSELIPFLNKGSQAFKDASAQAKDFGLILSEENIAASEDFMSAMGDIKAILTGIKTLAGVALLEPVKQIIEQVRKWIYVNRELIKTNLEGIIKGLIVYLQLAFKAVFAVVGSVTDLVRIFTGAEKATLLFIGALGILSGASILFGIGKLVMAIKSIGTAITLVQVKAFAIPLAIGAAVVAVILLLEDIVSFFQGKESFTGDLVELFKKALPIITKVFKDIVASVVNSFRNGLNSIFSIFSELAAYVENKFMSVLNGIISGINKLRSAFGMSAIPLVGQESKDNLPKTSGKNILDTFGGKNNLLGMSSLLSGIINPGVASAPVSTKGNTTNQISTTVNIGIPEGTPKTEVLKAVESGVSNGIEPLIRQSMRANAIGASY